jgi:hypothetical protein
MMIAPFAFCGSIQRRRPADGDRLDDVSRDVDAIDEIHEADVTIGIAPFVRDR